jgi:hypothetical protein
VVTHERQRQGSSGNRYWSIRSIAKLDWARTIPDGIQGAELSVTSAVELDI